MISSPVVLYPKTNWVAGDENLYYSSSLVQMISGEIPVSASDYQDNVIFTVQYRFSIGAAPLPAQPFSEAFIVVGATFEGVRSIPWSLNTEPVMTLSVGDVVYFEFKAIKRSVSSTSLGAILDESSIVKLKADIIDSAQILASVLAPTGVSTHMYRDTIKLLVPDSGLSLNPNNTFAGCLYYLSMTAGGGAGYVLMSNVPVTSPDPAEKQEVNQVLDTKVDTTNNLSITTTQSTLNTTQFYTFVFGKDVLTRLILANKIPNVFLADGITLSPDLRYYFVMTVQSYDQSLDQLVESSYSIELESKFLYVNNEYQQLPERQRGDVLFSISRDIMANNSAVSVVPGSVIRDMLDPISMEFEKYYTIQDFVFSCESIDTLMTFDDSNGDGISDPLSENLRKSRLSDALGITDQVSLQVLIDEQFDKFAANYNMTRNPAVKATGTATLYVTQRPMADILIPDGTILTSPGDPDLRTPAVSFAVKGTKIIDAANPDYFYNPMLKRYEVEVSIEAQLAGSTGNVPAGSITTIAGANSLLHVENDSPTQYGSDRESNAQLGSRIKIAADAYDSGTEQGYLKTVYKLPAVIEARVQAVNDPLMMRDYDLPEKRHIGGKVDVYVRGERPIQLSDQVAFKYEYPTDTYGNKVGEQFEVVNAEEFRIKSGNSKVSAESPIVIVIEVRNVTRGKNYDLTDLSIIGDGDTVVLSKNIQNRAIGMATFDVIEVDYRYRSTNSLILSEQPVDSIVSVTNHSGTIIDTSKYRLLKLEDPLTTGNSSISQDAVQFLFNENDDIAEFISVTDEQHDMLFNTPARLLYKGVTVSTIVVSDASTPTIIYKKDVDYSVTVGSDVAYTYLNLLQNSKIRHGTRVSVDYQCSENFNVTYVTNSLIQDVQTAVDSMKHACADVIAKNAIENDIDLAFKVIRKSGTDINLLKSRIQTSVANYVSDLRMGETFTQGALINVIQNTTGVKEISMPLIRMSKRNTSFIHLDDIGNTTFEVFHKTISGGVISYRSINPVLTYETSDNGGDPNMFRAVYEDNIALTMASSPAAVSASKGMAYIQSDGKIIVSTSDGQPPQDKYYKASYYVYYPADVNVVQDIKANETEYLNVDTQSLRDIEILDEVVVKRGL